MSVKIQAEKKLLREKRLREACEQELAKYREYCSAQESEIEMLRGLLRKHGIEDIQPQLRPVVVSKIDVVAEVNQITDKDEKIVTEPVKEKEEKPTEKEASSPAKLIENT